MDYFLGFEVIKRDPKWVEKVLLPGGILSVVTLLSMIPYVGMLFSLLSLPVTLAVMGWAAESMRASHLSGTRQLLPFEMAGDTLFKYMLTGVQTYVAMFVWMLPLLVVVLPIGIGAAIAIPMMGKAEATSEPFKIGLMVGFVAVLFFGIVMAIVLMPFSVIAQIRVQLQQNFAGAFAFKKNVEDAKRMYGKLLLAYVMIMLIMGGLAVLGYMACCVGIGPAQVVGMVVMEFVYLQLYEHHVMQGGEPFIDMPMLNANAIDQDLPQPTWYENEPPKYHE